MLQILPAVFPSLSAAAASALSDTLAAAAAAPADAENILPVSVLPPLAAGRGVGASSIDTARARFENVYSKLDRLPSERREIIELKAMEAAAAQIKAFRNERLSQARTSFKVASWVLVAGIAIIFAGIPLMYLGKLQAGAITAGSGIVSDLISLVLFKYYKEANDRLDESAADLLQFERASMGLRSASAMTDKTAKDAALAHLVDQITPEGR